MHRPSGLLVLLLALPLLAGCSSSGGGSDAATDTVSDVPTDTPIDAPTDTGADTARDGVADALPDTTTDTFTDTVADAVTDTPTETPVDTPSGDVPSCFTTFHGFCIRQPQMHTVPLVTGMGEDSTTEMLDQDYVCTFLYPGSSGWVYIQDTPLKDNGMAGGPEYRTDGAWTSFAEVVASVPALYNPGGNHRNDTITITSDGTVYRYGHSSMGWGGRTCRNADCLQVLDAPDGNITEDGCGTGRTLPVVCVDVQQDGTIGAFDDPFEGGLKCCNSDTPEGQECV
jgi:hypothetical protein